MFKEMEEKLKAELAAIEVEAASILARANFLNGAKSMVAYLLEHAKAEAVKVATEAEGAVESETKKE